MNSQPSPVRDAIADEAADWVVALRDDPSTERVRAQFMAWLRRSPMHVEEYLRVASTDRLLRSAAPAFELEELLADVEYEGNVAVLRPDRRVTPAPRRPHRALALLASAAVVALVAIPGLWFAGRGGNVPPVSYATGHGEQKSWTLADGSTVELDTDSEVSVHYSSTERRVDVAHGRAYFHVAKEPSRRFRVTAGSGSVVALGTRFDVDRRGNATVVTLVEGRVALFANAVPDGRAGDATVTSHELHAGEQATIDGSEVSVPVAADLTATEAWRSGQIAFDMATVASVATEFNRYAPVPVEIDDAALGARKISGSFAAHDLDSFLAYVQMSEGVVVERRADRILVHNRAAAHSRTGASRR